MNQIADICLRTSLRMDEPCDSYLHVTLCDKEEISDIQSILFIKSFFKSFCR